MPELGGSSCDGIGVETGNFPLLYSWVIFQFLMLSYSLWSEVRFFFFWSLS